MPQDGTEDFAKAFQKAQVAGKRVFKGVSQGHTLEGVWRSYRASLSTADLRRLRHHLEHGGEVRVFVILT